LRRATARIFLLHDRITFNDILTQKKLCITIFDVYLYYEKYRRIISDLWCHYVKLFKEYVFS